MAKLFLTKKLVKWFESEQRESGTEVALYNLIWLIATDMLSSIGVKRITTSMKKPLRDRL